MLTQVQILRYLVVIALQLPGSWKQKKLVLEEIKQSIRSYAFEGDYISYCQLCSRFGDPRQIVSAYLTEMPPEELLESIRVKETVVRLLHTAIMIAIAAWLIYLVFCLKSVQRDANGYTVVEVIELARSE